MPPSRCHRRHQCPQTRRCECAAFSVSWLRSSRFFSALCLLLLIAGAACGFGGCCIVDCSPSHGRCHRPHEPGKGGTIQLFFPLVCRVCKRKPPACCANERWCALVPSGRAGNAYATPCIASSIPLCADSLPQLLHDSTTVFVNVNLW